jgi:HD-like signal output (HDOD) protein
MKIEIADILNSVEQLPVLPATTVRLISVLSDNDTTINQIIEVVQYDQNLTMKILTICNSAYFGLTRKINSLREAVAYLGSRQLMQVVMGLHCNAMLQQSREGYDLQTGMLWRHSTAVALATEKIVHYTTPSAPPAGLLFTAGLLHDFGKVILDQALAEKYREVLNYLEKTPVPFYEAEHQILGYNHMEIGELIMRHWQLPEAMAAVCRYHHEPDAYEGQDPQTRQIINLVHIADALAISLGLGVGCDGLMYRFDSEFVNQPNLTAHVIDKVGTEILLEIKSLENLYQKK